MATMTAKVTYNCTVTVTLPSGKVVDLFQHGKDATEKRTNAQIIASLINTNAQIIASLINEKG